MGTKWKLNGYDLTVTNLAKSYVEGSVDLSSLNATLEPARNGQSLKIGLSHFGMPDPVTPLLALAGAGYLNHAQKATVAQVDEWAALVTFEDQLPLGITRDKLQQAVPVIHVVAAHKTLTVGSHRNARQDVDEGIGWLWASLKKFGVVKGAQPKFWR